MIQIVIKKKRNQMKNKMMMNGKILMNLRVKINLKVKVNQNLAQNLAKKTKKMKMKNLNQMRIPHQKVQSFPKERKR